MLAFYYGFILYFLTIGYALWKLPKTNKNRKAVSLMILSPVLGIFTFISILMNWFGSINLIPLGTVVSNIILFIAVYFTDTFDSYQLSLETFLDNANVGMIFFDTKDKVVNYNSKYVEMFKVKRDLEDLSIDELHVPSRLSEFYESDEEMVEFFLEKRDIWVQIEKSYMVKYNQKIGTVLSFTDVTYLKNAELEAIEVAENNQVLLEELHHRVRNNLQIISSMLSIQIKHLKDDETKLLISELENRINALAILHNNMHLDKTLDLVNIQDFIKELTTHIDHKFDNNNVDLILDIDNLHLDIDTITPFSLVINELIVNSYKHGFPNNAEGKLEIKLYKEGDNLVFVSKDNGVGCSLEDLKKGKDIGNILIRVLSHQIDGNLVYDVEDGLKATITFPDPVKDYKF